MAGLAMNRLILAASLLLAVSIPSARTVAQDAGVAALPADAEASDVTPVPVPEPSPLAVRFHQTGNALWLLGRAWELLVPAVVLFTGLSVGLRDVGRRIGRRRLPAHALTFAMYLGLTAVVSLPLSYYAGFVRLHAYGLSNQSAADWWSDWAKSLGVELLIAVPVLVLAYELIALFPRRWWLLAGLGTLPLLLGLALIKPVWIDPLFNDFGRMTDRALEARILALARRAGIEAERVYEVDKSRETKAVNAYVTGFLGTKRIVLWDTLLQKLEPDEVVSVMGHEMGHYALGHVVTGLTVTTGLVLLGLFAVHRAGGSLIRRRAGRFGFERMADPASLPLLVLLGLVLNLALTPVGFAFSRHIEHEADRFGLELTRDNHAAAMAFVKLQQTNLGYPRPGPFYLTFRASHPSLGERIDFANRYRPWERGEPLSFATLLSSPPRPPAE